MSADDVSHRLRFPRPTPVARAYDHERRLAHHAVRVRKRLPTRIIICVQAWKERRPAHPALHVRDGSGGGCRRCGHIGCGMAVDRLLLHDYAWPISHPVAYRLWHMAQPAHFPVAKCTWNLSFVQLVEEPQITTDIAQIDKTIHLLPLCVVEQGVKGVEVVMKIGKDSYAH